MSNVNQLRLLLRELRESGCAWTQQQTFASLAPQTIEESYELLDAVNRDNHTAIKSELGDMLYHVLFYAQIAEENGWFTLDDMAQAMIDKHEQRLPPDATRQQMSATEVNATWERQKQHHLRQSILDEIAPTLPAVMQAKKLQQRAAQVNFDWPDSDRVIAKVLEELAEVQVALEHDPENLPHEIGDLLFSCVNLARHVQQDPETCLLACNERFRERFHFIEQQLKQQQLTFEQVDLATLEQLWQAAKRELSEESS